MKRYLLIVALLFLTAPATYALEGIGPRVTVVGTINDVILTKDQRFTEEGGTLSITARNGQIVTVTLPRESRIVSEGRLSRKLLIPANLHRAMQVKVFGWRTGTDSLPASLCVIMNIEVNPALSGNGIIQKIDGNQLTVFSQNGMPFTYTITNETEVNMSYSLRGPSGLNLLGKLATFTLNPENPSQIRILRITGEPRVQ